MAWDDGTGADDLWDEEISSWRGLSRNDVNQVHHVHPLPISPAEDEWRALTNSVWAPDKLQNLHAGRLTGQADRADWPS